jgi:thiol-disulfide isomerase/thioredoxin
MMSRFGIAFALLAMTVGGSAAPASVKPGQPVPKYMVTTFDKQKISSDQLRGQVVIINLWATWCGPCKRELPAIDAYYRQHAKDGLRVFAVATDDSVPDYMLKPLAAMLAFPLAHRVSGAAFETLGGVPTSYIIDRTGVVRYAKADAFDQQSLDAVVGPLLTEPAPTMTAAQ